MSYLKRLPTFEYLAPRTVEETTGLLAVHSTDARVLAGGTDLIMQMRRRDAAPRYIVGLKGVSELNFIREEADGQVTIGAMTTLHSLWASPTIRKRCGILARTAAEMASPEVRNSATIGGNVCGALPCADMPPALLVLDARVKLQSARGERLLPLDQFFLSFERTAKAPDEILSEFHLPSAPPNSDGVYLKFHDRHSMDMTTLGVSAFLTADAGGRVIRDITLALSNAAPVPMRAKKTEAALRGRAFGEKTVEDAAALVLEEALPRDSWRASKAFRLRLISSLTKRALRAAWSKALSEGGKA